MTEAQTNNVEEEKKPWEYTRKTPVELEQLAQDVVAGRVFGSWNIPPEEKLYSSFMLLFFLDEQAQKEMRRLEIMHVYEYMSEAGPRSTNGMPNFMSCRYLDKTDCAALFQRCRDIVAANNARLKEAGG